ncbi:PIF1 family ATP-dependent DNA helicase [Rickettsiales bacterium]|nr:PIF1 family ATP-dependent DNA helicase [Rickettsiales bacterium]
MNEPVSIANLSEDQKKVIYAIEDGYSVFVTGSAGTGKSHLLRYLKENYLDSGLHITASTGIAAVNVSGQTIHSWAGIGLANIPLENILENILSKKFSYLRRRIRTTIMLAIDEISMISSEVFDILDNVFRTVRDDERPFGGIQMILFGDFFQLPPISKDSNNKNNFCFNSIAWHNLSPQTFLLKTVFRQKDPKFVKILDNIRFGKIDNEDKEILSSRINAIDNDDNIRPTILSTHNRQVESVNIAELEKINSPSRFFEAKFTGDSKKREFLKKNCLASDKLELKIGAQVMMLKNTHQKHGIINGSLGIIKDFHAKSGYPIVKFNNDKIIVITPEIWSSEKFDKEKNQIKVEASIEQVPLILSWAITIHKSQGMTLDKIKCNLVNVFSEGQIYVALSRVKTINGLFINNINFDKIKSNDNIVEFYRNLES